MMRATHALIMAVNNDDIQCLVFQFQTPAQQLQIQDIENNQIFFHSSRSKKQKSIFVLTIFEINFFKIAGEAILHEKLTHHLTIQKRQKIPPN